MTEDQVIELAPDAASVKAGKSLANRSKWSVLQENERVIWGEIKGSGKNPYLTQVDREEIAFKCSCPSRKFPCKHGLALLLVYAADAQHFGKDGEEPDWVKDWIEKRREKAVKKEEKAQEPVDEATLAKREAQKEKTAAQREERVAQGIAELELFLKDMIRGGLLNLPSRSAADFETLAKRMVDQQASGLASFAKRFANLNFYNQKDWQKEALHIIAEAWLAINAYKNKEKLPELSQNDIKSLIGWNQSPKELLEDPTAEVVRDNWFVASRQNEVQEALTIQRTWLLGEKSGRWALLLYFSAGGAPIQNTLLPGARVEAELSFFPSAFPSRAVLKNQGNQVSDLPDVEKHAFADWSAAQRAFAQAVRIYPWYDYAPQAIKALYLSESKGQWFLVDHQGLAMPLDTSLEEDQILNIYAQTAGLPHLFYMIRQGNAVRPLGFVSENEYTIIR